METRSQKYNRRLISGKGEREKKKKEEKSDRESTERPANLSEFGQNTRCKLTSLG